TPGAAAARLSANPAVVTGLSIAFAEIAAVGGLVLSLAPGLPVSVFVTTISFVIYLICRFAGPRVIASRSSKRRLQPAV
ncbi:putative ABC transporter permease protein, partial [Gordonia effusa NBRC 100432]